MAATEASGTRRGRPDAACSTSCATSDRFVLVTHEHPDGDALGSLVAMHRVLRALGKDSVMLMAADEFPLPYEYRFFDLDGLQSVPPQDLDERTVDLPGLRQHRPQPARGRQARRRRTSSTSTTTTTTRASARSTTSSPTPRAPRRSCGTSCAALGVAPTPEIAEALYVGLVTDTGKFMYENTGARAHLMAAELIEAGVDVHGDLPAPVRGHALRQARAARPRAGERRSATTTAR